MRNDKPGGDCRPDVVVNGRAVQRNVSQPGLVAFGPPLLLNPPQPFSTYVVQVADLNCDGRPDIVASDIPGRRILLWENLSQPGAMAFGPVRFLVPASGLAIAFTLGDLDGDGRPDLVTGDALGSGRVDVYLNRTPRGGALTDTAFAPAFSLPLLPTLRLSKVSLADMDGDGRTDVLVTGHATSNGDVFSNGTLAVFRQTVAASFGASSFQTPQTFAAGNYVSTMEIPLPLLHSEWRRESPGLVRALRPVTAAGAPVCDRLWMSRPRQAGRKPVLRLLGRVPGGRERRRT